MVDALLQFLTDSNSAGRYNAVVALRSALTSPQFSDSARVVDALLPFLRDSDRSVRFGIVDVLTESYGIHSDLFPLDQLITELTNSESRDASAILKRPIMARALFVRALRDPDQVTLIRQTLDSERYTRSQQPMVRLWSNQVLVILDLADLVHDQSQTREQRAQLRQSLQNYRSSQFFGPNYQWAIQRANTWIDRQYPEDQTGGR